MQDRHSLSLTPMSGADEASPDPLTLGNPSKYAMYGERLLKPRRALLALLIAVFVVNDLVVAVTQLMAPHAGTVDFHV